MNKKIFISALIFITVILELLSCAQAAEYSHRLNNVKITDKNVSAEISNESGGSKKATAIFTLYNETGSINKIISKEIDPAMQRLQLSIPINEAVSGAKVFIWNSLSDMKPLSETIYAQPSQNETAKTLDGALFYDYSNNSISFFETIDSPYPQKYSLASGYKLIINGIEMETDQNNIQKFIEENKVSKVTLTDSNNDGLYESISTDFYASARIESVNSQSGKIQFSKSYNSDRTSSIILQSNQYNIYFENKKIDISELQEGDILSIKYNPSQMLADSDFYDIYVSRETAKGIYSTRNLRYETVRIENTDFSLVDYCDVSDMNLGENYILYLDIFGRIFDHELFIDTDLLAGQCGVIERYTMSSSDDYYRAQIYKFDGTCENLEVDTTRVFINYNGTNYNGYAVNDILRNIVYRNGYSGQKNPIENRVVKFKISPSSGRIISMEISDYQRSLTDYEFKPSDNTISPVRINENTKIINAVEYNKSSYGSYSDLSTVSLSHFTEDTYYDVYFYGENINGTYPLAIITDMSGYYNSKTNFGILLDNAEPEYEIETGNEIYYLNMLYNNQKITLKANDDVILNDKYDPTDLHRGDIIVFTKDSSGYVNQIDILMSAREFGIDEGYGTGYETVLSNGLKATSPIACPSDASNWTGSWNADTDASSINHSRPISRIVYGPIIGKSKKSLKLGSIADTYSSETFYDHAGNAVQYSGLYTNKNKHCLDIAVTPDTNIYIYDQAILNFRVRLHLGTFDEISNSYIPAALLYDNGSAILWSDFSSDASISFAFAKVVDGTATDIFAILAP